MTASTAPAPAAPAAPGQLVPRRLVRADPDAPVAEPAGCAEFLLGWRPGDPLPDLQAQRRFFYSAEGVRRRTPAALVLPPAGAAEPPAREPQGALPSPLSHELSKESVLLAQSMSFDIPRELAALRIYGLLGISDDALRAAVSQRPRDAPAGLSRDTHELEVRQARAQCLCAKLKERLAAPTDLSPMKLVSGVGHEDQAVRNCQRAMMPTCIDRADAPRLVRGWRIRDHRISMTDPDGNVSTYLICQAEFHCVVATRRLHPQTKTPLPERYECKTRYKNAWMCGSSGGVSGSVAQAQAKAPQRFVFVPSSRAYPWLSDDDLFTGRWQTGSVVVAAIRMPELSEGTTREAVWDNLINFDQTDVISRVLDEHEAGAIGLVTTGPWAESPEQLPDACNLQPSMPHAYEGWWRRNYDASQIFLEGMPQMACEMGFPTVAAHLKDEMEEFILRKLPCREWVRANADRLFRFDFPELRQIFKEVSAYLGQDVLRSPITVCGDGLEAYFKMRTMELLHVALPDRAALCDFRRIVEEDMSRLIEQVLHTRRTTDTVTFNWSEVRRNMLHRDCEQEYARQLEQHRREAVEAEQQELKGKKAAERRARRTGSTGCSKA